MAIERERKFLVDPSKLPPLPKGDVIEAGYFTDGPVAIRATIRNEGTPDARYKVCFKGPGTVERPEFEYSVPAEDARALLKLAPTYLRKTRFDLDGWEVDNIILSYPEVDIWLAEWEEHEGKEAIPNPLPSWVIEEVTENIEYTNMRLAWKLGRK